MIGRCVLLLTDKCNASCKYCLQGSHEYNRIANRADYDIDKVVSSIPKNTEIEIQFFGGEPLLEFHTMIEVAYKIKSMNPKAFFRTITNGILLTKDKVNKLNELDFGVLISHDGKHHKSLRGYDDILTTNPELFVGLKNRSFATTATSVNYDFYEIWDYFSNEAIRLGFKPSEFPCKINIIEDCGSTDKSLMIYNHSGFEAMLEQVFCNMTKEIKSGNFSCDEFIQNASLIETLYGRISGKQKISPMCGYDFTTLTLDLAGNLYHCPNVFSKTGSINTRGFKAGKFNPYIHTLACQNCEALLLCGGGCTASPSSSKHYDCYIKKLQYKLLMKFLNDCSGGISCKI